MNTSCDFAPYLGITSMLRYNAAAMKRVAFTTLAALAVLSAGCESRIRPLEPLRQVETWVPDDPSSPTTTSAPTAPAVGAGTTAVTESAPPATQPGHMVTKTIDPNQTSRFIYNASYDNIWQQGLNVLQETGFAIDRQDYRLGALTTLPLPSAQAVEFWKPQHADPTSSLENSIHSQRRIVHLTISKVEGKPEFYEIAIQVLVERETNPSEAIGGPIFVEGSGFGRNAVTLRSDYAAPKTEEGRWVTLGHDPDLEKKLMDALFQRI